MKFFSKIFVILMFATIAGLIRVDNTVSANAVSNADNEIFIRGVIDKLNKFSDDNKVVYSKKGSNFAIGDPTITNSAGESSKLSQDKNYMTTTVGDLKRSYQGKLDKLEHKEKQKLPTTKVKEKIEKKSFIDKISHFFSNLF